MKNLVTIGLAVGILVGGIVLGRSFVSTQNFAGVASDACVPSAWTSVGVGDDISSVILATSTTGKRAWAMIQRHTDATGMSTSTPFLAFAGDVKATVNNGQPLSTSTPSIEFGLNTPFPYLGAVTGILLGGASTTVLVQECNYVN